jgi:signal-transduction protein with cAMP-binding, CBS, and nucleotidyltransferase domain
MELSDTVRTVQDRKGEAVWFVQPDASVYDAVRAMADKNVGALLVMDSGDLVGVISERDYTRKIILKDRSSRQTKVEEIMTTRLVTVEPTCTLEEAMTLMTRNRFRHLPIVEDGRVVGVVSMGDVVERLITTQRRAIEQLEGFIVGRYPG